jgi:hypothetical protein
MIAAYVTRTSALSCSGIQSRAPIGADSVYMSGWCRPTVCASSSQWSDTASGEVTYSILMVSVDRLCGGSSMTRGLPRIGSALSTWKGRLTHVVSLFDRAPITFVGRSLTSRMSSPCVSSTSSVAFGSSRLTSSAASPNSTLL